MCLKKVKIIFIASFLLLLNYSIAYLWIFPSYRGTDISSVVEVHDGLGGRGLHCTVIDWLAHKTNGGVSKASIRGIKGRIVHVITYPGGTNPTANYDIVLNENVDYVRDSDKTLDVMGGTLADRSATEAEQAKPSVSSDDNDRWVMKDLEFVLTGNSVNSAFGTVEIYWIDDK